MMSGTLSNCPECRNIECSCPKGIGIKTHEHKWEMQSTVYQYLGGYTGTVMPIEYAYLLCQCGEVKKVKVEKEANTE